MSTATPQIKQELPLFLTSLQIRAKYKEGREGVLFNKYMHQRACGKCYQAFRINPFELDLLCSLCAHLSSIGSHVSSKNIFFNKLTGNTSRKAKFEGYLKGLIRQELVKTFELKTQKGSLSLGVSPLGWHVVKYYLDRLEDLILMTGGQKKSCDDIILPSSDFVPERYSALKIEICER